MWRFIVFGIVFSLSSFYSYYFYYYFRYADYLTGKDTQTIHTLEELGWLIAGFIYIFLLDGLIFRSRRLVNTMLVVAVANMGIKLALVFNAIRQQTNGHLQVKTDYPIVFATLIVLDVITLGVSFPKPLLFRMASSRAPMFMEHLIYLTITYKHVTIWFTTQVIKITLEDMYTRLKIMIFVLIVMAVFNNFLSCLRYELEHLVMRVLGIKYLWMVNDESEIEDISSEILIQLSQPARELLRNSSNTYILPSTLEPSAPPESTSSTTFLSRTPTNITTIPPPALYSDDAVIPVPPSALDLQNEILNANTLNHDIESGNENVVLRTAANLNLFKDNIKPSDKIKLSELIRQFSQNRSSEPHVLNFTSYTQNQEYISQRIMDIAKHLENMSLSFNKYIVLLIMLTHYFEWIFNEINAPTLPVVEYSHYTACMIAYGIGSLLNMAALRKANSATLFWVSSGMIIIMAVRNFLILYTNYAIIHYIISALYPPILINLCRIYFANLRIYVHPDYKLRFRIEKFFIFYGYNILSVISAYLLLHKENLYVDYIMIGGSIAVVCSLIIILYQNYSVLLNVIYRSTDKDLFKVS